jgi:hypothetical protein
MYCSKCGVQNPADARFYSGCGSHLGAEANAVSEEVPTHYVGFWRRYAAFMIDSAILTFVSFIPLSVPVLIATLLRIELGHR